MIWNKLFENRQIMKTSILYPLIWGFVIFVSACSKDQSISDPPIGPSTSKTIGKEGGVIEFNDIFIEIPQGAFEESTIIDIYELEEVSDVFESLNSKQYRIDGLPPVIKEDIHVELLNQNGEETDQIILAYEAYKKSLNDFGLAHHFLPTVFNDGRLESSIPSLNMLSNFTNIPSVEERTDKRHWLNIFSINLVETIESKNKHFSIRVNSKYVEEARSLGDYLEDAYDKFKDMNFDYSERTKWPMEVQVKILEGEDGAFVGSVFGKNHSTIEINFNILEDDEALRVTAGHEFFHLVQSLYDPRSTWERVKDGGTAPTLWLDEAMSVWSEKLFSTESNYISKTFIQNMPKFFEGGWQANAVNKTREAYGYSLAPLIEFIHFHYGGDAALVDIYEQIKKKEEGMSVLNDIFLTSLGDNWPRILEEFLEFTLYPAQEGSNFNHGTLFSTLASSLDGTLPVSNPVAAQVFDFSIPDLGGKLFNIKNNKFTDFDPNAVLTFEILNEADVIIQVFRSNREAGITEKIAEGSEKVIISDFTERILNGDKFGAVVLNKGNGLPYLQDGETVKMKISISQPIEFEFIENCLVFEGTVRVEEKEYTGTFWDTTYTESIQSICSWPLGWTDELDYRTTLAGSTYVTEATGSGEPYLDYIEYTFKSDFDDPAEPKMLNSFEFEAYAVDSSVFGGYGDVTKWTIHYKVNDIPYDRLDNHSDIHIFMGDINSQQIEIASYTEELIFYEEGRITKTITDELQTIQGRTGFVHYHLPE